MKSLFSNIKFRFSLFWRYFSLLSIVVVIFVITLFTSINDSAKTMQQAYSEQARETFYQNCKTFSQSLDQFYSLITSMDSAVYYSRVSYADQPLNPQHYYFTSEVYEFFKTQCTLLSTTPDAFIYFTKNDICITSKHIYFDDETSFHKDYTYEVPGSVYNWMSTLRPDNMLHVFPSNTVTINQASSDTYITILTQPRNSNQIFGFLYPTNSLLNFFSLDALPENTRFQLISETGEVLLSYHTDQESNSAYTEFTAPISNISCTAVLGIPQSYFESLSEESQESSNRMLLFSILIGVLLCFLFSYYGVKPFQFLMREHALSPKENINEVAAIDSYLKQTKQSNEALRGLLLSSVLARTFYSLPIRDNELAHLTKDFPVFEEQLLLTVVRDLRPNPDNRPGSLFDILRKHLPQETICEHMSLTEVCIITPVEILPYEKLQRILLEINTDYFEPPRFLAGVSAPFTSLSNVSIAVRQAQLCIPEDESRISGLFSDTPTTPASVSPRINIDIKPFQQELASWNQKGTLHMLHNLIKEASQGKIKHPEETFYNLLFLLRDAAHSGDMFLGDYESTSYQHNLSPAANLNLLKDITKYIFTQKTQMQGTEIQHISQKLIQYVKTQYSNPDLSLSFLAQEFCVSESFVHKSLIAVAGTSFSKLLLSVRMQEAARLLSTTNKSNSEISDACGYLAISSFYRNFKNFYGMTPAEYKERFSAEDDGINS